MMHGSGAVAIIMPSVSIGSKCIVGAGAVVTKSFKDFSIIVGVPAKTIGNVRDCVDHDFNN